jgi:hypothetical protein
VIIVFQFIYATLSGRSLEGVYILNPHVLTIYIKWFQVCGSAHGNVRQCAAVCSSTGSVQQYWQCAAVIRQCAAVCGSVRQLLYGYLPYFTDKWIKGSVRQ